MQLIKLFLNLALIFFVIARGASEKKSETEEFTRKKTEFTSKEKASVEKMMRTGGPRYIARKKQEDVLGGKSSSKCYFKNLTNESSGSLSSPILSGKRKRLFEPTLAHSSRLAQTTKEKNIQGPMRREDSEYTVPESSIPIRDH